MRLNILYEEKCIDFALKLSSLAMNLKDFEFKSSYHFKKEDFRCIRDIYYACLEKTNKRKELIHHVCFFLIKYVNISYFYLKYLNMCCFF